ncbi:hypothetical protein CH273_14320 [Rhodococcus sp. 05-339-2]|nr:hypothetical protein CH273_14320 [Rhodococcus sp. 05-339-2]
MAWTHGDQETDRQRYRRILVDGAADRDLAGDRADRPRIRVAVARHAFAGAGAGAGESIPGNPFEALFSVVGG